jgi:hypothetical protein
MICLPAGETDLWWQDVFREIEMNESHRFRIVDNLNPRHSVGGYACFLGCAGGFQPIAISALHRASESSAIKTSAKAETFAGRVRAVGVRSTSRLPAGANRLGSGEAASLENIESR